MHGLKQRPSGNFRDVAPSNGNANASLSLFQRPTSGFKPKTSVPRGAPQPLCRVESDRTNRATELGSKITVLTLNSFNEWPSQRNNANCMF